MEQEGLPIFITIIISVVILGIFLIIAAIIGVMLLP
jgi:hypothetical protein